MAFYNTDLENQMKQFNVKDYLDNPTKKVVIGNGEDYILTRILSVDMKGALPVCVAYYRVKTPDIEDILRFRTDGTMYNSGMKLYIISEWYDNIPAIGRLCRVNHQNHYSDVVNIKGIVFDGEVMYEDFTGRLWESAEPLSDWEILSYLS